MEMKSSDNRNLFLNCLNVFLFITLVLVMQPVTKGQTYASQDGHALDANPRQGSMGLNTAMRLDALVPRANLYITGNIGQGASFQGLVPYRSASEMGATLGSSSLSNFMRDSVGVSDLSRNVSAPNVYIDPSRAVTGIYGGQVVNMARVYSAPVTPVGANLLQPPYSGDLSVRPLNRSYSSSLRTEPLSVPNYSLPAPGYQKPPWMTGQASPAIPGMVTPEDISKNLIREQTGSQELSALPPETHLGNEPFPISETTDFTGQTSLTERELDSYFQDPSLYDVGDVYSEVLKDYQELPQPSASEQTQADFSQEPIETDQPPSTGHASLRMDKVKGSEIAQLQIKQFNQYMKKGEEYMNKGKFYAAADAFETAIFYNSKNALPYLAKSHALFAAGELMSAAFFLQKAITLSPEMAVVPVDLNRLFPNPEKLEQRMADLRRWEERTGQPMLLFLQGYIQLQQKQYEAAKQSLDEAKKNLPENPSIEILLQAVQTAVDSHSDTDTNVPDSDTQK
jgi:predicted negative regulator of RcsB-dependent stress response